MAASIAKDLRLELEEMMQAKMQEMLLQLEERLAKAVTEGQVVSNPSPDSSSGKEQGGFVQHEANPSRERLLNEATSSVGGLELGDSLSKEPKSSREIRYTPLSSAMQMVSRVQDDVLKKEAEDQLYTLNVITIIMLLVTAVGDIFEVDSQTRQRIDKMPWWYKIMQVPLCTGFLVELIMRIRTKGWRFFTYASNSNWHSGGSDATAGLCWNYFQTLLVAAQVGEVTMICGEWWFGLPPVSMSLRKWFRIVSVTRIMRVFNILDYLDYTTELHLLLASMHGSLSSLSWSVLFIVVPMFVLGITITQLVAEFRISSDIDGNKLDDIMYYFGTLDRSMLTLFWAISGGLSWSSATQSLHEYDFVWTGFAFVLYVAAMSFATLNVLTGVFVNSATTAASSEKDKRILHTLQKIFLDVDHDGSGNLTHSEFSELLNHKEIDVCLQSLDIRPSQANHLFHLIDANKSGIVEIEEFLRGCSRLQGNLKAIDFATFLLDFEGFKAEMRVLSKQMLGDTVQAEGAGSSKRISALFLQAR